MTQDSKESIIQAAENKNSLMEACCDSSLLRETRFWAARRAAVEAIYTTTLQNIGREIIGATSVEGIATALATIICCTCKRTNNLLASWVYTTQSFCLPCNRSATMFLKGFVLASPGHGAHTSSNSDRLSSCAKRYYFAARFTPPIHAHTKRLHTRGPPKQALFGKFLSREVRVFELFS